MRAKAAVLGLSVISVLSVALMSQAVGAQASPSPGTFTSTKPAAAITATDPIIAAAGDIACAPPANQQPTRCHQDATAAELVAGNYTAVLAVGDEQYPCGLLSDYRSSYDRSWGLVKSITYPIPGDNEYVGNNGCSSGPGADGYFQYFGDQATPLQPGCRSSCEAYYSFDVGTWHLVALNSECTAPGVGGCTTTSAQYKWLVQDLADHRTACTLAYFHKPYWGNTLLRAKPKALVQALYDAGAEVMLGGHDHLYVRFAPQTPNSVRDDAKGIRQFVVGIGGVNHAKIKPSRPNTQVKNNTDFGVLELTLHPSSYDWRFLGDTKRGDGSYPVLDSGTDPCH